MRCGPCLGCGIEFESNRPKKFCTLKCYLGSDVLKERARSQAAAATSAAVEKLTGSPNAIPVDVECLECGKKWKVKPSLATRRFCSKAHYRDYMAKRFDRWIASPQKIALPQAYDEFMLQDEFTCLVDGCDWAGKNLSNHMNFTHGMTAAEFKKAAGFALGTGLVTRDVSKTMSDIANARDAISSARAVLRFVQKRGPSCGGYVSLEAREHGAKSRRVTLETSTGPDRVCKGCAQTFTQSGVFGRALFCTIACREAWYAARNREIRVPATCAACGVGFQANNDQRYRVNKGRPVFCCMTCRQSRNGSQPKPKRKDASP